MSRVLAQTFIIFSPVSANYTVSPQFKLEKEKLHAPNSKELKLASLLIKNSPLDLICEMIMLQFPISIIKPE